MERNILIQRPDMCLIRRVIGEWTQQHKPFMRGIDNERVYQHFLRDAMRLTNTPSAAVLCADDGQLTAFAGIEPSPWDSGILGVQVAKLTPFVGCIPSDQLERVQLISLLGKLFDALEFRARDMAADVIVTRSDARDIHLVQALESCGFTTMDSITTLYREIGPSGKGDNNNSQISMCIRPSTRDDVEVICLIAECAFRQGHFQNDTRIEPSCARRMYAQWAANSCNGRSDVVLVAEQEGQPNRLCGFIACNLDEELVGVIGKPHGIIDLVAVAPEMQGRGVGRELVATALDWFSIAGAQGVEVGTQLANLAAIRTYQSAGFSCVAFAHTLHKWLATT